MSTSLSHSGAAPAYTIDPAHSSAQFSVRHLMISNVKGEFTNLSGTVVYDPGNLAASKVEATIDAASINTRNADRDAHLRSPDFFDAAQHPTLSFRSTGFRRTDGDLQMLGELTMRGVTREVIFDIDGPTAEVKDPWGNLRFAATATTKVNRKDWGLMWNTALETGGVMVGDDVKITLDIQATRPPV